MPWVTVITAADASFDAVFGVFVVAFAVLVVVTLRWAIRRDRAGRAAWIERQERRQAGTEQFPAPPPDTNGRMPHRQRGRGPRPPV